MAKESIVLDTHTSLGFTGDLFPPPLVKPNDGIPELGPTQQDNAALQNSSPGPKQKTDQPLNINAASNAATPNKPDRALQIRGKGRGNKSVQKKVENKDSQTNRKLTDYYPIRRSSRKSKEELKNEEQQHINDLITNGIEEGLKVKDIEGKGRGVFADRPFRKGEFVVEYHGDLIQIADAKRREASYAQDPKTGCYMYYFQYRNKTYCVDATAETKRLGRLLNHSKNGNCQTRLHAIAGVPHLILVASRDIEPGEELVYDYGDRSREAIAAHPWLKH
ncbi:lysine methyltransferase 5Ab [Chanos chanos]|uniref:[histone H4]-lysine(20) N-methyltransferase n=1 Tax=Chanos chanos TaxID=29144 RepID=A0A6J2X1R5_CHACN|nr:N-lysine methyltransferase KMT5A-A-like [Chanos chanos]